MKALSMGALAALLVAGCGGEGTPADGGADMVPQLFKLQSGTYKVTDLRMLTDGCMVNPNDPANPTIGITLSLTNDGNGNIGLGNMVGTPMEPSNGASCPGMPANPACATATNPLQFNNNMGTLVRDNNIDDGMGCTEHRHIENLLTLTADNQFTSSYTRKDTMHMGCTATMDCTTTWTWDFVKQ